MNFLNIFIGSASFYPRESGDYKIGGAAEIQIMLSLDDARFSKALEEFCHYFQIPFIENNLSQCTYNAAKIYYQLKESGELKIPVG